MSVRALTGQDLCMYEIEASSWRAAFKELNKLVKSRSEDGDCIVLGVNTEWEEGDSFGENFHRINVTFGEDF